MKKIHITLALLVATTILFAQAPQKFSYQGVIRDAAGNLVRNAPVGVRVSLLKNSTEGVAVYCETHRQITNANGLLTLTIGDGTVVGGDMATIDWANGPYFLKTETDITGGSNYTLVGAQQLLSVPYALYAGNTTNGFSGDYNDLSNKPTIPEAQVNADWKATEGVAEILNKPTKVSEFENDANYLTEANLAARLDALQQQIDSLKEQIGEGGSSNDGKPCKGMATITDVDGNTYNTVQIGEQCWMKENLRTTKYADGTDIKQGSTTSYDVGYWYYPDNNSSNKTTYGLLYNWKAVMHNASSSSANPSGVQGVCPTGWHVPSDAEWTQLTDYVSSQSEYQCNGSGDNIAKALASTSGWKERESECIVGSNQSENNATGFSAVPAGNYSWNGNYGSLWDYAHFWSATESESLRSYAYYLGSGNPFVGRQEYSQNSGFSVRCIQDKQNSGGEADAQSCPGTSTATDVDGNTYNTVQIGEQCWMKENLRTEHYADGTKIDQGTSTSTTKGFWYYPNGDSSNKAIYGLLYNWKAVMRNSSSSSDYPSGVQGVCPTGWHVPSRAEWQDLINYVKYQIEIGVFANTSVVKALASKIGWEISAVQGSPGYVPSINNITGFSAVPVAEYVSGSNPYGESGVAATFWSTTRKNTSYVFNMGVGSTYSDDCSNYAEPSIGYSVRCLKD